MADDGIFVALIDATLKIYEYIKTEGPKRGLYMQTSKTKVWWPTMSADLLKTFDCKVLCNENGSASEGITLLGAAFGTQLHLKTHFLNLCRKLKAFSHP